MDVTSDDPWAGTGLDALGSRVLEYLVGHASASSRTVADAVGAPLEDVETALRSLEDALLVIPIAGRPPRWKAGPPRSSLGSLLARRRAELAQAELYMEQLHEIYDLAARPQAPHLVEVLDDNEEVAARYAHLLKGSTHEVLHLAKPPYVTGPASASGHGDAAQPEFREGLRLRSVYDTEGFTDAVSLETALRGSAGGGEFRLSSRLPVKLVLFDRTAALLPLYDDRPSAGSLEVRSPALIGALAALFEAIWEHAVPVSLESRQDWPAPRQARETTRIDERTQAILDLMATGMKDDAIARVLDISRRTVQKHVSEAGSALGARTRFQIALRAAERGWLPLEAPHSNE
ncbi:LuxR C-terminal-related transcriptional regulator [Streptomyces sp. NBC_01275]|uniref:helix-turn-helix transcriptional regulator n=1 Tax=Streptomyces sp. NBC_01275 TaxID=2903807 RepID=UPI002259F10B|nr:LuxR C-terminal-related transcriptional regulator [Streptomyces sp. NBC_01275]MCX4761567.1 LuxR C-terminal-related transcriptional regulator [Streptomyces sp. NBC_01275]